MTKKIVLRLFIAIIVIFLIFICYSAISIWSFGNKNQLVKTDAAVVLGYLVLLFGRMNLLLFFENG